jgi:hypothetical protein
MSTQVSRLVTRIALGIFAVLGIGTHPALAADVSTPELKAAFLLNFVRFAEWPDDTARARGPVVLCVFGDEQVEAFLEQIIKRAPSANREQRVRRVSAGKESQDCHLLYISSAAAKQNAALLKSLSAVPTLTVSDLPDFARSAGVLNFIVEEQRMRFVINTDAADRAGLRLSSKLLALARIVRDSPDSGPR